MSIRMLLTFLASFQMYPPLPTHQNYRVNQQEESSKPKSMQRIQVYKFSSYGSLVVPVSPWLYNHSK